MVGLACLPFNLLFFPFFVFSLLVFVSLFILAST